MRSRSHRWNESWCERFRSWRRSWRGW